jgi:hypothetical protein
MSEWVASIMTSGVDWLWSQRTRILLLATVMQRASPSGGEKGSTKKRGMYCSALNINAWSRLCFDPPKPVAGWAFLGSRWSEYLA